ncbi:hypothetical protein HK105_207741 [Polyrhizophydium stewartii]|uniref:C3H1-type domain-containing protein n=1 Tax=Polyrhizophydium stewartii TaxID=2732419 RepID=A0ABR4MZT3_9FUNG|nr:Target of EGR1, member 1 (Nuclear) [Polyrhizophydium stewartii]
MDDVPNGAGASADPRADEAAVAPELAAAAAAAARARLASFNSVDRHNLAALSLTIQHIISRAAHIAVDTEFTGLGSPELSRQKNIEDRYRALVDVVRSHALVAFGLAVFEKPDPRTRPTHYAVHSFQFSMLCRKEHKVSPSSMSFLIEHGFDFNAQIRHGIPYTPGNDVPDEPSADSNAIMRAIFNRIVAAKVPVVVHNGLLDAMFIYHSFYADLPAELSIFVSDMHDLFGSTGGFFDTKYISEFVSREPRTFLSYLFRKSEREEEVRKETPGQSFITIDAKQRIMHPATRSSLSLAELGLVDNSYNSSRKGAGKKSDQKGQQQQQKGKQGKPYCEVYAAHGFCSAYSKCPKSHDLDYILDWEETELASKLTPKERDAAKLRRAKRKALAEAMSAASAPLAKRAATGHAGALASGAAASGQVVDAPAAAAPAASFETYHSACFDAFMTGYIFAHQQLRHADIMTKHRNRVYLIGKPMALRIEQSPYSRTSQQHNDKRMKLGL